MIRMLFTFEDHTLSAHRGGSDWDVVICDHQTGSEKNFKWSDQLFAAVMDLAVGGDTHDAEVTDYLYDVIESVEWVSGDIDFRIIP